MVKKRTSSRSKTKATKKNVAESENQTPENEISTDEISIDKHQDDAGSIKAETMAADAPDDVVEIEEVEAEIVSDAKSDSPIIDAHNEEENINSDDVAAGVNAANSEKAPLSPGVVFLGVLGFIGIVGVGLWMKQGGDDQSTSTVKSTTISPLDQQTKDQQATLASSDSNKPVNQGSAKGEGSDNERSGNERSGNKNIAENTATKTSTEKSDDETPSTDGTLEKPVIGKVANTISTQDIKNDVDAVVEDVKTAALDESKINSLPTPPVREIQDGISETQSAAKAAAKQLQSESTSPVEEAAELFASNPSEVAISAEGSNGGVRVASEETDAQTEAQAGNQTINEEPAANIEETIQSASSDLDNVAEETKSDAEEAVDSLRTQNTQPQNDVAQNASPTEQGTDLASANQADDAPPTKVIEATETAEIVAEGQSQTGNTPTPDDQLGEDPIAAIKSLQDEADARLAEGDRVEGENESTDSEEIANSEENTGTQENTGAEESIGDELVATDGVQQNNDVDRQDSLPTENAGAEITIDESANDESNVNETIEEGSIGAESNATGSSQTPQTALTDTSPAPIATPVGNIENQGAANLKSQDQAVAEVTDKFAGEIAALEESFENRTARITEALNLERERAAQQAEEIADLKNQLEQTLAANEQRSNENIENLRSRIDALQSEEAKKADSTERQTAGLLSLISVQRSFDQGVSFERELNVLKNTMDGSPNLGVLERAAQKGAPTIATLKESFPEAIRTTLASSTTSDKGAKGPVGHFMRNIKSLVSVRPATPQEGETIPAIISRAEGYLSRDDLTGALREVRSLNDAASPAMVAWIEEAELRHNAVQILNTINDNLLSGIGN